MTGQLANLLKNIKKTVGKFTSTKQITITGKWHSCHFKKCVIVKKKMCKTRKSKLGRFKKIKYSEAQILNSFGIRMVHRLVKVATIQNSKFWFT